jgi:hypothetical protein
VVIKSFAVIVLGDPCRFAINCDQTGKPFSTNFLGMLCIGIN